MQKWSSIHHISHLRGTNLKVFCSKGLHEVWYFFTQFPPSLSLCNSIYCLQAWLGEETKSYSSEANVRKQATHLPFNDWLLTSTTPSLGSYISSSHHRRLCHPRFKAFRDPHAIIYHDWCKTLLSICLLQMDSSQRATLTRTPEITLSFFKIQLIQTKFPFQLQNKLLYLQFSDWLT